MIKQPNFKETYKGEFSPRYWIPLSGAVRAALNFGKAESAFHDTPSSYPTRQRILRTGIQIVWLGYQGITSLVLLMMVPRALDNIKAGLEKLF
ncbi:hypothetical protein FJZ17_02775 [Candidatus Pacearchaeota archaeon]|nr:hypothetical protein [Candidatus Pacearchaeota archaeon]